MALDKIKSLINTDFNRSLITVFSGTALSSVIPIISMMLLTRFYSPSSFGFLAIYEAVTQIIINIATGKYELAIFTTENKRIHFASIFLVIVISMPIATISGIIFFFSNDDIYMSLLISLGIVANSGYVVICNYYIKTRQFFRYARRNIFKSVVATLFQVLIFYTSFSAYGLIVGMILGILFFNLVFLFVERGYIIYFARYNPWKYLAYCAKKYLAFPKFSILSNLIYSLGSQAPIFFINSKFGTISSGFYSQARRNTDMPSLLLANSVGQVFKENFSRSFLNRQNFYHVYLSTLKKLALIGLIPCVSIFLFGEQIFVLFFGERWAIAGNYASILSLLLYTRFIFVPLSTTYSVIGKVKVELFWQVILAITTITFLYVGGSIGTINELIFYYSISCSCIYILNIFFLSILVRREFFKNKV